VYNSWRIFLLVMSLPSFIVAALLFLLPESPKFLISSGRHEDALEVFRSIYLMNTGRSKEEYPVKQILVDEPLHPKPEKQMEAIEAKENKSKMRRMLSDIVEHSKQLFVPPILKFTTISITINFTFHIG
jgi:MFS transporter, VNT family, synaptic vesicle glycoprotein 2